MNFELGQVRQRFSESPRAGEIRHILGWRSSQWLVVDWEGHGLDLNVGVGKGTTSVSDPWTVKAIVGFAFGH